MHELDREVAGVRCRDVLEHLSAYVDGELDEERVLEVDGHLLGCGRCERFGGRFAEVVAGLRRELSRAEALDPAVEARLRERLEAV